MKRAFVRNIMHSKELSKYFWLCLVGVLTVILLNYKEQL